MSSTKESFFVEDGAYGLVEFLFLMMILWGVGAGGCSQNPRIGL